MINGASVTKKSSSKSDSPLFVTFNKVPTQFKTTSFVYVFKLSQPKTTSKNRSAKIVGARPPGASHWCKNRFYAFLNQKSLFFTQNHLFELKTTIQQIPSIYMDIKHLFQLQKHVS
jgi:hypothetical protein